MLIELSSSEMIVVIEALKRAATRQESEARYDPRNAGPHEKKARDMRRLALRIETAMAERFALNA